MSRHHTHTHAHMLTYMFTHAHTRSNTHAQHTQAHTRTNSHTYTISHTCTHTRTHTLEGRHTCPRARHQHQKLPKPQGHLPAAAQANIHTAPPRSALVGPPEDAANCTPSPTMLLLGPTRRGPRLKWASPGAPHSRQSPNSPSSAPNSAPRASQWLS